MEARVFNSKCPEIVPGLAIIVMGISGAGKSTVGHMLAKSIPCQFIDADSFHSVENIEKMRNGVPLTDDDRMPWLQRLRDELVKYISNGECVVLACSALRCHYRDILLTADPRHQGQDANEMRDECSVNWRSGGGKSSRVLFVYLKGDINLFASRLEARYKEGTHFMPPGLLKSQMDTLEVQDDDATVISVDASLTPEKIVELVSTLLLTSGSR